MTRLKGHVHYSVRAAERYMLVARFSKTFDSTVEVFDLDPTVLYRIAALPDTNSRHAAPDTLLTDPLTGRQTPLKDMSSREISWRV
jgi:hypothetical protein